MGAAHRAASQTPFQRPSWIRAETRPSAHRASTPQAAGEDQHLSVGQVYLGQLQVGAQGDPVGAGDGGTGEGRPGGGLQAGLPEQVGGDNGLPTPQKPGASRT